MRSKQQAEREEQQRIKNLVLNYDLRDENEPDGDSEFLYILQPNPNRKYTETGQGLDKQHNPYTQPRVDKAGSNRSNQRARKLQLSDVDWYGNKRSSFQSQLSLSDKQPLAADPTVSERRDSLPSTPNSNLSSSHRAQDRRRSTRPSYRRNYRTAG
jgi:regulator of nonsense transcripts 2